MPGNDKPASRQSFLLHDLLTPLNHIVGFTDLILEELDKSSKEEIRADVEKVKAASNRMLAIVQGRVAAKVEATVPAILEAHDPTPSRADAEGSLLVVDDDPNNRMLVVRNLKKRGYQVAEATDGLEALELVHQSSFDLILCDLVMPRMDGVEFLRRIQAEFGDSLPVMVISALDQMETVEECLDLDAVDFISKPFEPYMLLAKVRAIIRRKRRRDELGQPPHH